MPVCFTVFLTFGTVESLSVICSTAIFTRFILTVSYNSYSIIFISPAVHYTTDMPESYV